MSENVISFARPQMRPDEFEAEVRHRASAGFEHMVLITDHAVGQMRERQVTRRMVLSVLQKGGVDGRDLRWNAEHGNWTAPMVGITAGVEVRVICAICDGDLYVTVVTAHRGRR